MPPSGLAAAGLKVDRRHRLFVSGAGSKTIRVHDACTGGLLRSYAVPDSGFINDVVVTRRGAYFTDSNVQQLYFIPFGRHGALGDLERIPITGDFVYGAGFNANGIDAARGGRTLILVKTSTGELFTADAATGVTRRIALDKHEWRRQLQGRKLYVVRNQNNLVAVVRLSRDLTCGTYVRELSRPESAVPTTIARSGGRFWVVNAKFGANTPDQSYQVVQVPKK